ncbi:MAG: HAD hydrolase family protein [Myxococcales bacterium]|nr:HAD hydrolase family protein [Myxococcales bacterium]
MYRLLALDLDGTLLRSDHTVDARDVAAIAELQAAGVTVTIATGRLHSGAVDAARACAIDGLIACVEGSHLIELSTGTTHAHHPIPDDVAARWRDAVAAHQLAGFVFDADGIHHDAAGGAYVGYVRTWSPNVRIVDDAAWPDAPLATVAIGDLDAVTAAHAALRPHHAWLYAVTFAVSAYPGKHALLARAAGPTKGTALAALCDAAGCTLAEAVAIGDWVNDVPMFEVAGRSFAMGGAPDAVRAKATDVLARPAGAGGGIAEAIRRAWG